MQSRNKQEKTSLRSQCMLAYTHATLAKTDSGRYSTHALAGYLLNIQEEHLMSETLRLMAETSPQLLKRNVDALALLTQVKVQESASQEEEEDLAPSPLAQPDEDDVQRVQRLRRAGTASECLLEAMHWLNHYLGSENGDLEPVSTALALNERALSLLPQPEGTTQREVQA